MIGRIPLFPYHSYKYLLNMKRYLLVNNSLLRCWRITSLLQWWWKVKIPFISTGSDLVFPRLSFSTNGRQSSWSLSSNWPTRWNNYNSILQCLCRTESWKQNKAFNYLCLRRITIRIRNMDTKRSGQTEVIGIRNEMLSTNTRNPLERHDTKRRYKKATRC